YSSLVRGCRNTGKSLPTGRKPSAIIRSGVAPTTTQSRSAPGRPSSASRTAPPTRYAWSDASGASGASPPPLPVRAPLFIERRIDRSEVGRRDGVDRARRETEDRIDRRAGHAVDLHGHQVVAGHDGPARKLLHHHGHQV